MSLDELIEKLEAEDPDKIPVIGFANPHSYRGYYDQLAFEIVEGSSITVGEMLNTAKSAIGKTFIGYKGGEYQMDEWVSVWIVKERYQLGDLLGEILLDFMLGNK